MRRSGLFFFQIFLNAGVVVLEGGQQVRLVPFSRLRLHGLHRDRVPPGEAQDRRESLLAVNDLVRSGPGRGIDLVENDDRRKWDPSQDRLYELLGGGRWPDVSSLEGRAEVEPPFSACPMNSVMGHVSASAWIVPTSFDLLVLYDLVPPGRPHRGRGLDRR